jgi:hypothetical protein
MKPTQDPGSFFQQMIHDAIGFGEACRILKIEKYSERIINCQKNGEVDHLPIYIKLAKVLKDSPEAIDLFVKALDRTIEFADDKDVDSVFIDAPNIFMDYVAELAKKQRDATT